MAYIHVCHECRLDKLTVQFSQFIKSCVRDFDNETSHYTRRLTRNLLLPYETPALPVPEVLVTKLLDERKLNVRARVKWGRVYKAVAIERMVFKCLTHDFRKHKCHAKHCIHNNWDVTNHPLNLEGMYDHVTAKKIVTV